jgi:hypothetical protein
MGAHAERKNEQGIHGSKSSHRLTFLKVKLQVIRITKLSFKKQALKYTGFKSLLEN